MRIRWGRILLGLFVLTVGCGALAVVVSTLGNVEVGLPTGPSRSEEAGRDAVEGGSSPRDADEIGDERTGEDRGTRGGDAAPASSGGADRGSDRDDLPPFRVLTLQYTPYMATLVHMDAGGYMEALGYDLQLVDVYDEAVDLDEVGQCEALKAGEYDALATTIDATRKCGQGVVAAIPIGQSAGNDAIVVKPGVDTWSEIFDFAIAYTGYSVSEYMACFASHTAAAPIRQQVRADDAAQAVDMWINSGPEQDIASVVAWEPEVSRALESVPGSEVILSSRDVRILWDVIEFPADKVRQDPAPFTAFTEGYYAALLDLTRDPASALRRMVEWAGDDEGRQALLTTTVPELFEAELSLEAFATLRDAAFLMEDLTTLQSRLEEAGFYWRYCGVDVPDVPDLTSLVAPQFVLEARENVALLAQPNERPGTEVFQVTDYTNAEAVSDAEIAGARVLFETGVDIEFVANRTDFRDPAAALDTLANAVRFLRTCSDCILEVQGSSAFPGGALRRTFTEADADALALDRGRRVYDELLLRFDVPEAQLNFVEAPRERRHPGSVDEEELRLDRRTYLTGYQLSGGM